MRIGIDASVLGPRTRQSGIGRYVRRLLEHLPALDPASEWILFAPADCPRPPDLPPSLRWQPLPRLPLGKLSTPAAYLWSLRGYARRFRLDLFHAPTVHPRPSWPPVPRGLPCPLVVTVHDLIPLTFYSTGPERLPRTHLAFYRWNLRAAAGARRILTVSETARGEIIEMLRVRPEQVVTINNGVDHPEPDANGASTGDSYILFVGSYEARKNLATVMAAFRLAGEQGLRQRLVVVAPAGSGRSQAEAALRTSGMSERVTFVDGHTVTDAGLADLYRGAGAFVFPSQAESFGLPPLEAAAAGVPVVVSDLPAHHEVLGNGALFVAPLDAQALAGAILRITGDRAFREDLAQRGRRRAAMYSWEECARRTLQAYGAALADQPARIPAPAGA